MESQGDEALEAASPQRQVTLLLHLARTRRIQGDWEAAHRLHRLALAVLNDASPRYSIPRVRFDIEEVTEDTCLFFHLRYLWPMAERAE
ncbi:hypothetical protein F441_02303 [Phytophthora nicotianae CJ01A1]|uniref:Uncharacterized protein n=5 Tax=Phytophthora nicotianae TaxID=4792 RepID=W2QP08_PHYN3|nr:hypothetical protein PPTG_07164 [Phytophthora nicotianae INRA-310]ETI54939.1 hypothetical protein F443_02332 [Phytophthora nicotianae P1569]ETK94775.1 hypothetical protein L915_02233 [Phytophthora nicotianae]ETO83691.1 hypothetical protein F444_02330 [Phytophthora nicotianae P1976]ETP24758.1 hypothetical protein F441_02303 [Phytophthora nicotianae CJ01A1]ETL48174.1 hypothetical protein L916_02191 [Phytophthora nicotianae]